MKRTLLGLTIGSILLYTVCGQEFDVGENRWEVETQSTNTERVITPEGDYNVGEWTLHKFEHTNIKKAPANVQRLYETVKEQGIKSGFLFNDDCCWIPDIELIQVFNNCTYEDAEYIRDLMLDQIMAVTSTAYRKARLGQINN